MKKLLLPLICSLSFALDIDELYKQAQELEKQGQYKKAMNIYKQIASENVTPEETKNIKKEKKTLLSTLEKKQKENAFKKQRENIYERDINKTEDEETNNTIKQIITANFDLHPYKKNYLLPVTYDLNKDSDRRQLETTYQLSFVKPIFYNLFGLNEVISGAYTQKSFWQTFEDSAPFRETNYEPEIFMHIPYERSKHFKGYKIALNHQSNGRGKPHSRSWNKVYAEAFFQTSNLFIVPKVWYRIPDKGDDDNPDLEKYMGYGNLKLIYPYKKHLFELTLRNNLRLNSQNKGAAEFNWTFPMPEFIGSSSSFGMLQVFSGYGNNLIDYDRETHRIGIGIAFAR